MKTVFATGVVLAAIGIPLWFFAGSLPTVVVMVVAVLSVVAYHERQIRRLVQWAKQPLGAPVPEAGGSWSNAFLALHRRARQAKAQRDELHEMGERFRLAAEALPEGVIILDEQRCIEWMNPRAELLLQLTAQRDVGMAITHLLREPEFVAYLENPQQANGPAKPLLVRPMRNGGRVLHIRGVPFSAGRTLLLIEDLTQLERLETVRRDFVANVSHEMRTPLTVVQGFLETARDGITDPDNPIPTGEVAQFLDLALDHARRMQRLIGDLLTLSSLETDAPPQEGPIEVASLLAVLGEEIKALSGGRHEIIVENKGPPILCGSEREIHSAFANLASNAVRYTPTGGQIRLSWRTQEDGCAAYDVTDTGIGIDSQDIPRLTERFYRVDRGRSRETGGTGLGLAIVKHVLERHQAKLIIDSKLGAGSTFTALFPQRRTAG